MVAVDKNDLNELDDKSIMEYFPKIENADKEKAQVEVEYICLDIFNSNIH